MRTVIWKLTPGTQSGQETAQEKLEAGIAYIDKLKSEGEIIKEVKNEGDKLVILLEDND